MADLRVDLFLFFNLPQKNSLIHQKLVNELSKYVFVQR